MAPLLFFTSPKKFEKSMTSLSVPCFVWVSHVKYLFRIDFKVGFWKLKLKSRGSSHPNRSWS